MHDQQTIYGWTASRSGAAMTVKGKDEAGNAVKVPGVRLIGPDKLGRTMAITDVGGPRYELRA